jgi:hypothetical protein
VDSDKKLPYSLLTIQINNKVGCIKLDKKRVNLLLADLQKVKDNHGWNDKANN